MRGQDYPKSTRRVWLILLSFDPGATRCGWALVKKERDGLSYIESGVLSLVRGKDEGYQDYRERLIRFWVENFSDLIGHIDEQGHRKGEFVVAFEIVPAVGFRSGGAVQSQLAQVVVTTCQVLCQLWEIEWRQVSATSVKKGICGFGDGTKVQVRDGVLAVFPELEPRKKELTSVADEADAIAVGIVASGYKVPKQKGSNPRRKRKERK